jgi:hypothetical protein
MPVLVRETDPAHQWCRAHTSGEPLRGALNEADEAALGADEPDHDQPLLRARP